MVFEPMATSKNREEYTVYTSFQYFSLNFTELKKYSYLPELFHAAIQLEFVLIMGLPEEKKFSWKIIFLVVALIFCMCVQKVPNLQGCPMNGTV